MAHVACLEAYVLSLERGPARAEGVFLDQNPPVRLPAVVGYLHVDLLRSFALRLLHLVGQARDGLWPVELDHDVLNSIRLRRRPARATRTCAPVNQVLHGMSRIFGRIGDRRQTRQVKRRSLASCLRLVQPSFSHRAHAVNCGPTSPPTVEPRPALTRRRLLWQARSRRARTHAAGNGSCETRPTSH